jgi:GNAT superfamily N-acetyltransferase
MERSILLQPVCHPLTPERWEDFESLFGERGACGGCWCMWWRIKRSVFEKQKGPANRKAMKNLVDSGYVPGLLVYIEGKPAGWCALGPRDDFPVLQNSRILKPVDNQRVWSVVCFYIDKAYRKQGLSVAVLKKAVEYVKEKGGIILEGYPVEPRKEAMPAAFAWTGIASAFLGAGFREVARRSDTRPIMRYYL